MHTDQLAAPRRAFAAVALYGFRLFAPCSVADDRFVPAHDSFVLAVVAHTSVCMLFHFLQLLLVLVLEEFTHELA